MLAARIVSVQQSLDQVPSRQRVSMAEIAHIQAGNLWVKAKCISHSRNRFTTEGLHPHKPLALLRLLFDSGLQMREIQALGAKHERDAVGMAAGSGNSPSNECVGRSSRGT